MKKVNIELTHEQIGNMAMILCWFEKSLDLPEEVQEDIRPTVVDLMRELRQGLLNDTVKH